MSERWSWGAPETTVEGLAVFFKGWELTGRFIARLDSDQGEGKG